MSETRRGAPAEGLARRLADAARATVEARTDAVGRCAVPVAVDAWGAVSERCPLRPLHDGDHEIESAAAQRQRRQQAAAVDPGRVLGAVEVVEGWLADASRSEVATPPPLAELWLLVEVTTARAALDATASGPIRRGGEVATDG